MSSVILEIDSSPKLVFLAPPPPPKKKYAAVRDALHAPASPVNRSHTILAWANSVHSGSPAPMTSTSLSRSTSFTSSPLLRAFRCPSLTRAGSRRQSVSSTSSRIPSISFPHLANSPQTPVHPTPVTPFPTDAKFDLTAFGYASIFVDVVVSTPITPEIYRPKQIMRVPSYHDVTMASLPEMPATKSDGTGVLKRLFSNRSKAKPQAHINGVGGRLDSHISVSTSPKKHRAHAENSPGSVEEQKRELYAGALPPTVKQEAQMRQATGGGSPGSNTQKATEEKTRREGVAAKVSVIEGSKVVEDVETPHRDGQGKTWWDQEEEREFTHLLASYEVPLSAQSSNAEGWVTFNYLKEFERDDPTELSSLPSSKYTDLYHSRPSIVTDEAVEQFVHGRATRHTSVAGSIVLPSPTVKPSNILLATPSRPNRGKHLQPGFLKDVIAVPPTPLTPSAFSQTSRPPHSPARATRFIINTSATPGPVLRQRSGNHNLPRRHRKSAPPPLKIIPICPVNKLAVNVDLEEDKNAFLGDYFKPEPVTLASRWSMETVSPRPLLTSPEGSDTQVNSFALADIAKKSRRLGGFFKKGERKH